MEKVILAEPKLQSDYTSVIVSYSTGIDSTGALYWAINNFPKEKIYLLYCDTGMEYDINVELFYKIAKFMEVKPILLQHPKGFLGLLLEERLKFPDMKNRWCTSYLKTGITDKWIRANRHILGEKCLFISGERRDESPRRSKLPEIEYHRTTLKTERVGKFECHWFRPCLDFEKGQMFEQGKQLHLNPHPCYEYVDRCSCMFCVFMKDKHTIENMKRNPEQAKAWVQAEIKINHTWKAKQSLQNLWNTACEEIEDGILG